MKNIALVLPEDYKLSSVATILDVFETVNHLQKLKGREIPFRIHLLQTPDQILKNGKRFHQYLLRSTRSKLQADLVLIPAFTSENLKLSLAKNRDFLPWLQKQYRQGSEIASFCTGAFLFAESGLLNGKLATTHVDHCSNMIIAYPTVFVKPGRTLTVDWNCYTSGGSTSSFHLLIYLVQKFCGQELAVRISKVFAIELDRHQQSYFSTFRPDHSHNDELVKKVQQKIESNYLRINTIEEVTKNLPASRRNIVRRFKQVTGVPPITYLQNVRIETAKKLLEQGDQSISEIITQTGYADPKSFRKVFLKLVGITPIEYRDKFRIR